MQYLIWLVSNTLQLECNVWLQQSCLQSIAKLKLREVAMKYGADYAQINLDKIIRKACNYEWLLMFATFIML